MGTLALGATAYILLIHWTCKRLEQVSGRLREPA